MATQTDNVTEDLFDDLQKYLGNPDDPARREEFDDLWDQYLQWESSDNSLVFSSQELDPGMSTYMKIRTPFLATVLIGSSLLGVAINIAVICLAVRHRNQIQSSRAMLIVNLCCACLLFLLGGLPLLVAENVFGLGWNHGETLCQLHRYVFYASFYILGYSIVLLLLHVMLFTWVPLRLVKLDKPLYASVVCLNLWILVLLSNIPNFLGHGVSDQIPGYNYCYAKDMHEDTERVRAWTSLQFTFTFAVPLLLMIVLTVLIALRMRRGTREYSELRDVTTTHYSVLCLCVSLTLAFLICWMPDKVFALVLVYRDHQTRMGTGLLVTSDLLMCLAYSNPSVNPVLVLICILRPFLPCASSGQETSTNGQAGNGILTNQVQENCGQPQSIGNKDEKRFISVV